MTTPSEPASVEQRKWFRQPVTPLHLIVFVVAVATILVLNRLEYLRQEKYSLDASHVPWSAGDLAVMRHGSLDDAAAIPALRGIPNVTVSYYEIDANDRTAIGKELWANSIHYDGRRTNAISGWWYDWKWDAGPGGSCGTANAQISFRAHVALPRIGNAASLSPEVARDWQTYGDALARHEANHVRHAYEGRERVIQAVRASSCASANEAGQRVIDEIGREAYAADSSVKNGDPHEVVYAWGWKGLWVIPPYRSRDGAVIAAPNPNS